MIKYLTLITGFHSFFSQIPYRDSTKKIVIRSQRWLITGPTQERGVMCLTCLSLKLHQKPGLGELHICQRGLGEPRHVVTWSVAFISDISAEDDMSGQSGSVLETGRGGGETHQCK